MINRLKQLQDEPEKEPPAEEFYMVHTEYSYYYVAATEALRISQLLERLLPPRWIAFTDLFGSRIRVQRRHIEAIIESTREQRKVERDFSRARKREDKEGQHPWEDD